MSPSEDLPLLEDDGDDDDEVRATTPYRVRTSAACIDQLLSLESLQLDGRATDIVGVSIPVAAVAVACCVTLA